MSKFALDSIKIKSSWFEGGKNSVFQKMGKEEGLNLYLQLFRFRVHQGDYDEHFFYFSIDSLVPYTKVNKKHNLSKNKVFEILKNFENLGIVRLVNLRRWRTLLDEKGNVLSDKFIILEATDVPITTKNRKIEEDLELDFYIPVKFEDVNYVYGNDLSSKHLSIFFLLRKLSNNSSEKKAWININTIEKILGYGAKVITNILIDLNRSGLIVTNIRRLKEGKTNFEHHPYFSEYESPKLFLKENKQTVEKFLRRYGVDLYSQKREVSGVGD